MSDAALARALEDASDAKLTEVIDSLAGADSPEQLALRAVLQKRLAGRMMLRPAALLAEAADAEARAAVQRKIRDAEAGLAAAGAAVADTERAATAAEEPERKAGDHALAAAHLLSQVRDDLQKAAVAGAEPARLLELRGRVSDAEAVYEHERNRFAVAQQSAAAAREGLAGARDYERQAREALTVAEAALDQPLRADLDPADRAMTLLLTWPARAWFAAVGDLPPMSDEEREIVRVLAGLWADELGAIPAGAAALVRGQAEAEIRERARHTMIDLPGGQQASVAGLMTGLGVGGPGPLATTAQGR